MAQRFIPALALALGASVALPSCSEEPAQASFEHAVDAHSAGVATSILNAGVMVEIGPSDGVRAKLLFDPLYDDHFGSLEQLTPELIEAIVLGAAPYDGADAVFVSHAHGDHFSESQLTAMLAAQPELQLVAPGQAIDRLREFSGWEEGFAERTHSITLNNGEASQGFEIAGVMVEAFRSPHNGWPDRHFNTHNITFRVSAPSGEGRFGRVMHLGDADPAAEHYVEFAEFLAAKRTGLAMVPFWFYQQDDLQGLIDERLNAEMPVAMHVPVRVPNYLSEGQAPYFSETGEQLDIPATE